MFWSAFTKLVGCCSRDRNREHAKYTRLRKKAYMTKLKALYDELKITEDAEETDRTALGEKILQQQRTRSDRVRQFLTYRENNCRDRSLWAALLDEKIVMTMPITPYRSFPRADIEEGTRVVRGIDAVLADTSSLALLAESIGLGTDAWKFAVKRNATCKLQYTVKPGDLLSAGELSMCRYALHILHSEAAGGTGPCVQHGMLSCRFDPATDRILTAEFVFDVMGFMQQLQVCWGISPENSIVPNTFEGAMQPCKEAQAVIVAAPPFAMAHVNDHWKQLLGDHQLVGGQVGEVALVQALQVYAFQRDMVFKLASDCARGIPGSAIFLSHARFPRVGEDSDGAQVAAGPTVFYMKLLPLTSDSDRVSHCLATLVELPLSAEESRVVSERAAVLSQHPRYHLQSNMSFSSLGAGSSSASASASGDTHSTSTSSSGHQHYRGRPVALSAAGIGAGTGVGAGHSEAPGAGESSAHPGPIAHSGTSDGSSMPTTGSTSPLLGMFTASCGTNSNPHYTPAMLSGNPAASSRHPSVFPFPAYPAHAVGPVPFSLLYPFPPPAASMPSAVLPAPPGPSAPGLPPHVLSAHQFMAAYPHASLYAHHPSAMHGAGMVSPGEVYLSQEALRNNPNAVPRSAPNRDNAPNPHQTHDQQG